MKEYRALMQSDWEKDEVQVKKVVQVVSQIVQLHQLEGSKSSLVKAKYLIKGVIEKIEACYLDPSKIPSDVQQLRTLLEAVEGTRKKTESKS
mmetsp:Transcript_6876/g.15715  ORF Transcript_6876/g.15715 Transcript_6876/m.15715 type:complete len:92 (-) Transcript_6876:301-576(-)